MACNFLTERWRGWMCHAGTFLHLCHLPVSRVSMTKFSCDETQLLSSLSCGFIFSAPLSAPVRALAWAWPFPSSLPGALASPVTTNPNWPAFCLQHEKSLIYSWTFWMKSWNLSLFGRMPTSTRRLSIILKTASGEPAQVQTKLKPPHSAFFIFFVSSLLLQVHQCVGSSVPQLCHKHKSRDAA